MEQFLRVGVISATHGIKGEVKVFPTTDDPARFKALICDRDRGEEGDSSSRNQRLYSGCKCGRKAYACACTGRTFGLMNFYVLTLFPDMIRNGFRTSITGRAMEKGLLSMEAIDIRDFSVNKHNRVDDYPYGGGAGMVMQAEPVYLAYESVASRIGKKSRVLYMSPQGRVFDQRMAEELAREEELIFLCGHYEGIDERVLEEIVTDEISVGDYVLTGGELPALVIMDAVSRLLEGVLHNEESAEFDSFHDNLLEYPQYSRPEEWRGKKVPSVLLSGHHMNVEKWRREQSLLRTKERRPDLLARASLTKEDKKFLANLKEL